MFAPMSASHPREINSSGRMKEYGTKRIIPDMRDWQIITLERLFGNFFGESLYKSLYRIPEYRERLRFLVQQVERMTGLQNFGIYMNKLLTIDAFFLNEDRHMHNIAVLMNGAGDYAYCPIFDNGAGLLADTTM